MIVGSRRALSSCLTLALVGGSLAAQGENGYLRGKGNLDIALESHGDTFEEIISAGPGFRFIVDVERTTTSLYTGYGLTDDLDLVVQPLYSKARFVGLPGINTEESDLQDLLVYAKWRFGQWDLSSGAFSLLFEPGIKVPLTDYENRGLLALGGGQVDLLGRFIAHYQAHSGGYYVALEAGYDRRNGSPPDQLPFRVSAGVALAGGKVWVTPFYDLFESRGGSGVSEGNLSASGADFDRIGVKAYAALGEKIGLTATYRVTDDGRATGPAPGFSFGLVLKL